MSTREFNRRAFLAALMSSAATPLVAAPPTRSPLPVLRPGTPTKPETADRLIATGGLSGTIAFTVADAKTGEVLEARLPNTALPPASVAKAVTAVYALGRLGAGARFLTRLVATGPISNGRVEGDLVLLGGGDPTLDTNALASLAAGLKAAGVREVRGKFVVDAGALPSIWEIDDKQPDYVGYNPGISGLNLNYNRVHFEWKRAAGRYSVTMDARSDRYRPAVQSARMKVVDRTAPVYTYASNGGVDDWTVARSALGNGGARWLPVRKPEAYAADVFRTLARSQGIVLPETRFGRGGGGTTLATHRSAPMADILRDMLKFSTNVTAEAVGLAASRAAGGTSSLKDSSGKMSRWAREASGAARLDLVDHSGLGDRSRMTARDMVKLLVAVRSGLLPQLMKPIPLKDAQGRPDTRTDIDVRAKTGTLNFVSALAGYITTKSGRVLAFSILTADLPRRRGVAPEDRERPAGSRSWTARSRGLQQDLVRRWARLYD